MARGAADHAGRQNLKPRSVILHELPQSIRPDRRRRGERSMSAPPIESWE
jgi:hypothetical protein